MLKRMKSAAGKLKSGNVERKCAILLPHDVLAEVLRHFSRKELCQKIYLVNRQFYNIASCPQYVSAVHVIDFIYFYRHRVEFHPLISIHSVYKLYLRCTNRTFNLVGLPRRGIYYGRSRTSLWHSYMCCLLTHQLKKMPVPSPCIRFRDVYIYRIFGESMLQYLRNAKQSFIGSIIFYGMRELENTDMKRQMFYLLENVFHKPSYVFMYGYSTHFLNCVKRTEDLPNCTNVKLTLFEHFHVQSNFNEDSVRILVDWLQSSKNVTSGSGQTLTQKKHLTLIHFPRSVILNMVQQIRDDFESSTLAPSDFVVTFIGSWESPYYLSYKSITLEGDQEFVLDKVSGNGRLSFFRHCPLFGEVDNLAYRLWSRTVISEAEDSFVSTILQNSKKMYTNELYRDFYRVDYPHGDLRAWYSGFPDDVKISSRNDTLRLNGENIIYCPPPYGKICYGGFGKKKVC